VLTYALQEIAERPGTFTGADALLAAAASRLTDPSAPGASPSEASRLLPGQAYAGRRLIVLLFDVSSMQPEDVQRAVDAARAYAAGQMSAADLVAVAAVGSTLDVLTDFTAAREAVDAALSRLAYTEGLATTPAAAATAETEEAEANAGDPAAAEASELDLFNNDVRLRALRALADTLAPIEQKKAILYFSAGMPRSGQDNLVELRAAINAAVRAHVAVYPVDVRGLQAIVPGGDARQASRGGQGLFSGRGVSQQFSQLAASQDTLTLLGADTGGRAFTDTNDFGEAFARVQHDMSAYYLLGYSSTNLTKDGRFRRVQVRVRREGLRVEARAGYYAARDFAHTSRRDREAQLQEQLLAAVSATDLPVLVSGGFFRLAGDRYYVPIAVVVPGSAVPVARGTGKASLDVLGSIRDEQGRPVGRIRQSMEVHADGSAGTLAGKQVLYESGVTLPPGRFSVKVVVRENEEGLTGSFEAPIVVPELKAAPIKISSVVLGTELQAGHTGPRSDNPLTWSGVRLIPNVTHVVGREQTLYFYFEIYDPAVEGGALDLGASLAFYRGKVKVLETPVAQRTSLDLADRRAAVFRLEVPARTFKPGLYTCQVNVIDRAAGTFAFPRMAMLVR
jgi:VWFA-related protein